MQHASCSFKAASPRIKMDINTTTGQYAYVEVAAAGAAVAHAIAGVLDDRIQALDNFSLLYSPSIW